MDILLILLGTIPAAADDADLRLRQQAAAAYGRIVGAEGEVLGRIVTRGDEAERRLALRACLSAREPGAAGGAAALGQLASADAETRRLAALLVARIGRQARPALATLTTMAQRDTPEVRRAAVAALAATGQGDGPTQDLLARLLADPDPILRREAARALGMPGVHGPGGDLAPLLSALSDSDVRVRQAAEQALVAIGRPAAAGVSRLVPAGGSRETRRRAVEILGQIGWPAPGAVDALVACLGDPDPDVRRSAAEALGRLGARDRAVLDALTRDLADPDGLVQVACAGALASLGQGALVARSNALPAGRPGLAARARDDSPRSRLESPPERPPVPVLVQRLASSRLLDRETAARELGERGPAAAPAAAALAAMLDEPDADLRAAAATALGAIGGAAFGVLVGKLDSPSVRTRRAAAEALGRIGPSAGESLSVLSRLLADADDAVRASAVEAIGTIAADPKADPSRRDESFRKLVPMLHDRSRIVREATVRALVRYGRAAVAPLVAHLADPEDEPAVALGGLNRLGPDAEPAIPALVGILKAGDDLDRVEARDVLVKVGRPALTAVLTLLRDRGLSASVKRVALEALVDLEPRPEEVVDVLLDLMEIPPALR
jgi:HEAT repeat protein